jgi:hypothetical protein
MADTMAPATMAKAMLKLWLLMRLRQRRYMFINYEYTVI